MSDRYAHMRTSVSISVSIMPQLQIKNVHLSAKLERLALHESSIRLTDILLKALLCSFSGEWLHAVYVS